MRSEIKFLINNEDLPMKADKEIFENCNDRCKAEMKFFTTKKQGFWDKQKARVTAKSTRNPVVRKTKTGFIHR